MLTPLDPIALARLTAEAGNWLTAALAKRRNAREQLAAHVLHDAGLLVAATMALDTGARRVASEFTRFDSTWTPKQRAEAFDVLNEWASDLTLIRTIRRHAATLDEYRPAMRDEELVSRVTLLVTEATNLAQARNQTNLAEPERGFPSFDPPTNDLRDFWTLLQDAKTDHDVAVIHDWVDWTFGEDILQAPAAIDTLGATYAGLKAHILGRYPSLPAPAWDAAVV
jgi:hypothetical protein